MEKEFSNLWSAYDYRDEGDRSKEGKCVGVYGTCRGDEICVQDFGRVNTE